LKLGEGIKKEGCKMKGYILYAVAILGNVLLIYGSEKWYDTEWLLGLITVVLFALFLLGWKRFSINGGIIFITAFSLFSINSIFLLQNLPAAICSLMLGIALIPFYANHRDAVLTSGFFVLINILMSIDVRTIVTMWMFVVTGGIASIIGFRLQFILLKRCFIAFFTLTALFLLLITESYKMGLLVVFVIGIFVIGIYKLSRNSIS